MDAYLRANFTIQFTDKEIRLIGLALAGKLKRPEDIAEGQKLSFRLLEAQKLRLTEQLDLVCGAMKQADVEIEKQSWPTPRHLGSEP